MKSGILKACFFAAAVAPSLMTVQMAVAQPVPLAKDWTFDVVRLKNGYTLSGVILNETPTALRFQNVRRATGRPTICMTTNLRLIDIERIDKISEPEREYLKQRLSELDPTGEGERKRMESLELERCDWKGKPKGGWRYNSDYFSLTSSAPEEIVRRSAVRLEQIYAAYANFLPPRFHGAKSSTILLYPSFDEYQQMLADRGWKLQNAAFFNPQSNRIFCGSNLLKLGMDLEDIRQQHLERRAILDEREAELRKYFGKKPMELNRLLQSEIIPNRQAITRADKHNDAIFDNATKRLFAILYHEAFHAYVSNFVYPAWTKDSSTDNHPGELPRWLNEGLAQIFETAIVEAGELRVGHADKERLLKVKEAIRNGELMPVRELLESGPKAFLVQHNDERLTSDRAYLASWALSAYLSFDRRMLGSPALDTFIRSVNQGGKPDEAFVSLTNQKLPQFEKDFHAWLLKLTADGSMLEPMMAKER